MRAATVTDASGAVVDLSELLGDDERRPTPSGTDVEAPEVEAAETPADRPDDAEDAEADDGRRGRRREPSPDQLTAAGRNAHSEHPVRTRRADAAPSA